MVNYTAVLREPWVLIASEGEDYVLQVIGDGEALVKASTTAPTGTDGAFSLETKAVITSQILSGNIYARAGFSKSGNAVQIVYAK